MSDMLLLDTNVLVYYSDSDCDKHAAVREYFKSQNDQGEQYCVAPQNLSEFFAVVTDSRRVQNARTPQEAHQAINQFLSQDNLTILPVPVDIVPRWLKLVGEKSVSRAKIFDLQLIAVMQANNVRRICTYNVNDFIDFDGIEVVSP